jgi:hypothetical protein
MKIKIIMRGLIGYFPWLFRLLKRTGTGGTDSSSYCYSVWLRHLVLLNENGMETHPDSIAEIGPGDSIGIGLNALITGASKYYAFDIIHHADLEKNIAIFDELVLMYECHENIPHGKEYEKIKPKLSNYDFPSDLLTDKYLEKVLNKTRLNNIRKAIISGVCADFEIKYVVVDANMINLNEGSLDLIYSQAVMEHVIDINDAYRFMGKYLKNAGFLSHEIDYSAHETHDLWYGHWTFPRWLWKIILNGRQYAINRYPNSYHINVLRKNGFHIQYEKPFWNKPAEGVNKKLIEDLRFSDRDLKISSCYLIASRVAK